MKTIRSQTIASTGLDSHGESIPREELERLFEQMPDPWLLFDNHDPSKCPIARAYNKNLVQLGNGNWGICADVDIFDESKLSEYGGFSISFSSRAFSVKPDRSPEIVVGFNPLLIDENEIAQLCRTSTEYLQIDGKEIKLKAHQGPAIIFLEFVQASRSSRASLDR